jgi:hypothetical protein
MGRARSERPLRPSTGSICIDSIFCNHNVDSNSTFAVTALANRMPGIRSNPHNRDAQFGPRPWLHGVNGSTAMPGAAACLTEALIRQVSPTAHPLCGHGKPCAEPFRRLLVSSRHPLMPRSGDSPRQDHTVYRPEGALATSCSGPCPADRAIGSLGLWAHLRPSPISARQMRRVEPGAARRFPSPCYKPVRAAISARSHRLCRGSAADRADCPCGESPAISPPRRRRRGAKTGPFVVLPRRR